MLDSARTSSSSAVTSFFAMTLEKVGMGGARRGGKERDRTRGDQTERWEGGGGGGGKKTGWLHFKSDAKVGAGASIPVHGYKR